MADRSVPTDFIGRDGILASGAFPKTNERAPCGATAIDRPDNEGVSSCQAHRHWYGTSPTFSDTPIEIGSNSKCNTSSPDEPGCCHHIIDVKHLNDGDREPRKWPTAIRCGRWGRYLGQAPSALRREYGRNARRHILGTVAKAKVVLDALTVSHFYVCVCCTHQCSGERVMGQRLGATRRNVFPLGLCPSPLV